MTEATTSTAAAKGPKVNRARALRLGALATAGNMEALCKELRAIEDGGDPDRGNTWEYWARRVRSWLESGLTKEAPFSIFTASGNSKLPFYAFSSLAGFDCPGAGACLFGNEDREEKDFLKGWCYSFTAWRYPAAFFRQLQNSVLLRFGNLAIVEAFKAIPQGKTVRLYVDGDFHDLEGLRFWMDLVKARPDLDVYGYSKSWQLFLALDGQGYAWPENYSLNLSSGSRYGPTVRSRMENLACVRGEFVAVPVNRKWIDSKAYQDKGNEGSKDYRAEVLDRLRDAYEGRKVFACPGNCGNCLPGGKHACGSDKLQGVVIGIGIHG